MDEVRVTTEELLDERPEYDDRLRAVLAVDAEQEGWTFEDVPLTSGEFGEVVSRRIVERGEDGYSVANRAAVEAALSAGQSPGSEPKSVPFEWPGLRSLARTFVPSMDGRVAGLVVLALALVFIFRVVPSQAVFHGEDVVLSGNDPYSYRWTVERMLAEADGPLDFSIVSDLPAKSNGEPLLVATLWWVTELLGGEGRTAGLVLAWYPVASAVVTGLLVYSLAARATDDRRVGVAAVSFLAIIPLHAIRTGVGFADHHAFDYPWLVLTALALVLLAGRDVRSRQTWGLVPLLGFATSAQVLAWNSGPLLLVPLGIYVVARAVSDVRADRSPLSSGVPVACGVGMGAALVYLVHLRLGWHTDAVAFAPVALLVGVAATVAVAEGHWRLGGTARQLLALQGVVGIGTVATVFLAFPSILAELEGGVERLFGTEGVAEAVALFSGDVLWVIGPLVFFGFGLVLVVPYMTWAVWRIYRSHDPALLVVAVYGWYLFTLTAVQIRFGGEFSPFAAVFAGLGFVHLAWWVDLARLPAPFAGDEARSTDDDEDGPAWPERRTAAYTVGLWLGVGSLGAVMSTVKHAQLTIEADEYEVAKWLAADADARGLEYPENYVFSHWGRNRLYNYFVSGESERYNYARDNFASFIRSSDPDGWYERLRGQVGYVVAFEEGGVVPPGSIAARLERGYGSRRGDVSGLAHYRARYVSDAGRTVFEVVPGATVEGSLDPDTAVDLSVRVEVEGAEFTYERRTVTDESGRFEVTVAYPGPYDVSGRTVHVPESAVRNGDAVSVDG